MPVGFLFITLSTTWLTRSLQFMKAQEIIDRLTNRFPRVMRDTVPASDTYSVFDFSNETYLIEVKSRRKRYNPWMIERKKVKSNLSIARERDKHFLYITECEGIAYVWNISRMMHQAYNFKWVTRRMPATTDFNRTQWVDKEVGFIKQKDSRAVNLLD